VLELTNVKVLLLKVIKLGRVDVTPAMSNSAVYMNTVSVQAVQVKSVIVKVKGLALIV
jgi:hypothetical protein